MQLHARLPRLAPRTAGHRGLFGAVDEKFACMRTYLPHTHSYQACSVTAKCTCLANYRAAGAGATQDDKMRCAPEPGSAPRLAPLRHQHLCMHIKSLQREQRPHAHAPLHTLS